MPQYTNSETVTLTGESLVGPSTIANINSTGEDAYARVLIASNAEIGTVHISSGGTMYMRGADAHADNIYVSGVYAYQNASGSWIVDEARAGRAFISGGVIENLTLDNEGLGIVRGGEIKNVILKKTNTAVKSSVKLYMSKGVVSGGSSDPGKGAKEIYAWGGVVSNFTMNQGMWAFCSNGGSFKGGSFSGSVLAIRGGTVESMTFLNASTESHHRISNGVISSCTIVAGASYAMIGGLAKDMLVSGANARFRVSGANAVMEGGTVMSGGSLMVSIGKASGVTVGSSGWMVVSGQNAVAEKTVQSGESAAAAVSAGGTITGGTITNSAILTVDTNGTANDMKILTSARMIIRGGGVNNVTVSGASARFITSNGGVVNNPVINEFGAWGYASNGAVINNAAVYNGGRLLIYSGGTALNPTVSQLIAPPSGASMARIEVSSGGFVSGGYAGHENGRTVEVYLRGGGTIKGMTFGSGAFVLVQGTVEDCIVSQTGGQRVNLRDNDSGASGLFLNGKLYAGARLHVSTGVVSNTIVKSGASLYCAADNGKTQHADIKDITVEFGGKVWLRNTGSGGRVGLMSGGVVKSGGTLYTSGGGVARDVRVEKGGDAYSYNNAHFSGGMIFGNLHVTNGGKTSGALIQSGGVHHVSSGGSALDTVVYDGGAIRISSGGTVVRANVSAGGGLYLVGSAASANNVTVSAGGGLYLIGSAASANNVTAEAGAIVSLELKDKVKDTASFDSLANVGILTIADYKTSELIAGTYTLADAGNTTLKVRNVGSRVFDGEVAAGGTWVNPLIERQFNLNAAGTELTIAAYTRTSTGEAATFAQSGSVINGGDKALEWQKADITGKIELLAAPDTVAGNAWLDIRSGAAISGAQIFGTAENVTFGGKISYQIHGTGGTIGNLAAGANYGGSVKGVDILAYGNTFLGVGYAGGFGTVGEDGVQVVFGNKDTLKKDFYGGALYNAAKVAAGTTTSVSTINMQFGESAGSVDLVVSGNLYGGGAVKAGTVTTTANTSALHTVGKIDLTLLAGTATKGGQMCVFAGGYATGQDTAKLAPVYTVQSVTVNVNGGSWGAAAGGRGVFGGAMASDNLGTDGVYAQVGNVNMTIAGGTMGNVYGGGWAQRGAKSEVGDVNITITGGTITNVFGGGSTSTSGGTTVADDVTITVSGGTITGDIYSRGHTATDSVTGAANVIFTGNKDFGCGVWGYTYVDGDGDATLSFNAYTGTFSGNIGGFNGGITLDGDTAMTLATAAAVSNTAWIFDFNDRDLGLDGQAALTWNTADFTEDTVTLRIASTRSEGWTLVSGADASKYNTAANAFAVEIDGAEAISLTFDATTGKTGTIADTGTAYDGWGFAVEDSVLKFTKLA